MSLVLDSIGTRSRMLNTIGIPLPLVRPARIMPARPPWQRVVKSFVAPFALAACDFIELTIQAAGFGLLMVLFLFTIYVLG